MTESQDYDTAFMLFSAKGWFESYLASGEPVFAQMMWWQLLRRAITLLDGEPPYL